MALVPVWSGHGLVLAADAAAAASPADPRVWWGVFAAIVAAAVIGWTLMLYQTRLGIIARATVKEAVRQPVFWLMGGIAVVLIILNTFIPFFSLGDDVKMLKDCGLVTILFSGLVLAVWTASTSIADEIEGKTAMTLLSKPINRLQFILGKFTGIVTATWWLMIPVSVIFLMFIYYKVGYDARESSNTDLTSEHQMREVIQVIPGLVLCYLEVIVLSAVSVAISTRLPMIVNMVSCTAIYIIGHLAPSLVYRGSLGNEIVSFIGKMIATVLPQLDVFSAQTAISTGQMIPPQYVLTSSVYCLAYSTMALLLAFLLFEDRDLA